MPRGWVLGLCVGLAAGCAANRLDGADAELDGAVATDAARVRDAPDAPASDGGPASDADAGGAGDVDGGDGPAPCGVPRADVFSPPPGVSWRHGGGAGYPDLVDPDGPCTSVVRTRGELEAALAAAGPDHVVYVADDARIDLTGVTLCVPGGVTLASGRGRDGQPGGLLYTTATESRATLRTCGDDVRITGLRLHGWEPTQCPPQWPDRCEGSDGTGGSNCRDCMPRSRGLQSRGFDRLEVDNCELTGWTYGAVELADSLDNHVHHNHIHHNQRQGLGYGVVLSNVRDPADVLVEHNRFDYNRHSIAASGAVGHSYEARDNLVLSHANGHVFDVHGIDEALGDGTRWAGTRILVHRNTVLPPDHYALVVRGEPTEGAWIYDNCLARTSASQAARQRHFVGSFFVDESPSGSAPNRYGQSESDCEPLRFCASSGGAGPWRYLARSSYPLSTLGFGDFDADGLTDVIRTDGAAWWWLAGGRGGWDRLRSSSLTLDELAFGDFDGDGRTDAFRADGVAWSMASGARDEWTRLNTSAYGLDSLAFGDFDGDGRADVFRTDGSAWWVSRAGRGAWERLNTSSATLGELGFGDFDGDGATDVFRATGSEWLYSAGGASAWMRLNASSRGLGSLALADVDGDGTTDVLAAGGSRWRVSWGGRSAWEVLAVRDEPPTSVVFGELDGLPGADAFRARCL